MKAVTHDVLKLLNVMTRTSLAAVALSVAVVAPSLAQTWLLLPSASVPRASALQGLGRATQDLAEGRADRALAVFRAATTDRVLGGYAWLYVGRAQLALGRPDDAAAAARELIRTGPTGVLAESALWLSADAAEATGNWADAAAALEAVAAGPTSMPARAHLRLGRAALRSGDTARAHRAFTRVYYEYALSPEADDAAEELAGLAPNAPAVRDFQLDLNRAITLYGAARYTDARRAFQLLRPLAAGADIALLDLRLAQCEFHLKRFAAARDAVRSYLDRFTDRSTEAQYYYLSTMRELGPKSEYLARVRAFVEANARDPLARTALNDLATYYILADDDAEAAAVFLDLYDRDPAGTFADRAAWKAGWWAYKTGDFKTAIRLFETAAVTFRRADYRPSWLYWAARAHAQLGEPDAALIGFQRVIADYRNSYYGRAASREAERVLGAAPAAGAARLATARRDGPPIIMAGTPPPNAGLITALLAAGLYDDAILEVKRVQSVDGTSSLLEATIALALNRKGDLRPAITGMRRAYPQFMADGGEALPRDVLTIIFPVDHWNLIEKYATARKLDPYLMLALIAQESTFQADIQSAANAWGLMQIVPATGRRYAQRLGIRPFSTVRLTDPEVNIRIGMAYFADLLEEFRDVAAALAAYNAGESRVTRWLADRPGVDRDEFVDDIPFPETQNYVKRVLGTAEDYRILYRDRSMSVGGSVR